MPIWAWPKSGMRQSSIFLKTHFHADFVSGHLDLAKATGAPIIFGPNAETNFLIHRAKDGEVFPLGDSTIEVLHTPGHTIESSCYLVRTASGDPHALFTGDTLFVGDVGRPDLSSGNLTREELAGMLFDSLRSKIVPFLAVSLFTPRTARAAAVEKSGAEHAQHAERRKENNYALKAESKEDFVRVVTDGLDVLLPIFPSMPASIRRAMIAWATSWKADCRRWISIPLKNGSGKMMPFCSIPAPVIFL